MCGVPVSTKRLGRHIGKGLAEARHFYCVVARVAARVAAARHCLSAVVSRLVTRRPHTVVVARRQVRRYHVVVTLPAAVLALALRSSTLPRARRAVAPAGRISRARPARLRPMLRRLVHCRHQLVVEAFLLPSPHRVPPRPRQPLHLRRQGRRRPLRPSRPRLRRRRPRLRRRRPTLPG